MSSMNGKKCRIVGPLNEDEQRYPVFVYEAKEVVFIKPINLWPVSEDHGDHRIDISSPQKASWCDLVPSDPNDGDDRKQNAQTADDEHFLDISRLKGREYRLRDNATVLFYERFLEESRVRTLWKELMTLNFERSEFQIRGKTVFTPRLQSWMRDEGITREMASLYQKQPGYPWSESMSMIKRTLEKMLHCTFHYVLINYYRNGRDSIAWHSDGEAASECKNVVGSVSLRGPRRFLLRHRDWKRDNIPIKEFLLTSGCLLVMKDDTQKMWKHTVPKSKLLNPRINLTFRQICDCESCSK